MIFVTVGVSQPFPRLIKKMDEIAPRLDHQVVMQIGPTKYEPQNALYFDYLSEKDFQKYLLSADILVGHAGTGTTLNAILHRKKCILVPRRQELGEHSTNHQLHHVRGWQKRADIQVVLEMEELESLLVNDISKIPAAEVRYGGQSKLSEAVENAIRENRP